MCFDQIIKYLFYFLVVVQEELLMTVMQPRLMIHHQKPKLYQRSVHQIVQGKYLLYSYFYRSMRYCARMKAKKQKAVKELFSQEENEKFLFIALSKLKIQKIRYASFVRCRSVIVRKLLTNKPATAVAILKHVWDQEYKNPHK